MPLARFMRFATPIVWALGTRGHTPFSEQHPLCTKFQGHSHPDKLQPLPSKYVCRGENGEVMCSAAEDVPETVSDCLEGELGIRREDSETLGGNVWDVETVWYASIWSKPLKCVLWVRRWRVCMKWSPSLGLSQFLPT